MQTMTTTRSRSLHICREDNRNMHYRITVMGAAGVGKSCIISQFLYERFMSDYRETIEELHRGEYEINGNQLTLDILDTSGAHAFPAMRQLAITTSDAFVLVYSFDDVSSFEEVESLRDQIIAEKGTERVPIVIVGNKCDLPNNSHQIERETTKTIVQIDWENGYVEVSAKENINIVGIFKEILTQCNSQYALSPAVKRRRASIPVIHYQMEKSSKAPKPHSCVIS